MAAGVVTIPWYATGFRGDALEQALEEVSRLSLRYGATSYHVYRWRDDRYRFLQVIAWEDKLDWERFWEGEDMIAFRVNHSSYYQVPVIYSWVDQVAHGEVAPEPVSPGPEFSAEGGTGTLGA